MSAREELPRPTGMRCKCTQAKINEKASTLWRLIDGRMVFCLECGTWAYYLWEGDPPTPQATARPF